MTEVDKIFPRWYTAKSRKPFCGSKRPQVFRFFTEHRNPLRSKAFSLSTRHYTEQSAWRGQPKIRKIAEVFHFTHLGPVTPRAQGHSIAALQIPSSVLKQRCDGAAKVSDAIAALQIPSSVLKRPLLLSLRCRLPYCSPPNTVIGIETPLLRKPRQKPRNCSPPNTVIGIETREARRAGSSRMFIAALQIPSSVLKPLTR